MRNYEGLAKRDMLHFTPAGYVLQADMLFKAIRDSYGDYLALTNENLEWVIIIRLKKFEIRL